MKPSQNSIFTLMPYKWNSMWVFDDEAVGLRREAFVGGADDIIEKIGKPFPEYERGFLLLFSPNKFPGHTHSLNKLKKQDKVGTTYHCNELKIDGWLCPALFHYFTKAPKRLYAQGRPITHPKISAQEARMIAAADRLMDRRLPAHYRRDEERDFRGEEYSIGHGDFLG